MGIFASPLHAIIGLSVVETSSESLIFTVVCLLILIDRVNEKWHKSKCEE